MIDTERLQDGFRGALVGCAVGDALGFPVEGRDGSDCEAYINQLQSSDDLSFPAHPSGKFPTGQFTDDTQLSLALAESLGKAGCFNAETFRTALIDLWQSNTIIGRGQTCTKAVSNMMDGAPWNESGCGEGRAGNGAAMRAGPVGLLYWKSSDSIVEAAELQSIGTHTDDRAVEGAVILAGAVAWALRTDRFVLSYCLDDLHAMSLKSRGVFQSYITDIPGWISGPISDAASEVSATGRSKEVPQPDWPGISPYVVPSVLWALVSFARTPTDFLQVISNAILPGGDVDTTAAMAGAIAGAHVGLSGIPSSLSDEIVDRDRLIEAADRLLAKSA